MSEESEKEKSVIAVCRYGFVVGPGERVAVGEVIEMSARDFSYAEMNGRVRRASGDDLAKAKGKAKAGESK